MTTVDKKSNRAPIIVIPAYRPTPKILEIVDSLLAAEHDCKIIVVDDGSGESFAKIFQKIEKLPRTTILRHAINQGKGQALKTAFNHVLLYHKDCLGVVTADADGQHLVHDILNIYKKIYYTRSGLVLGVRKFEKNIPMRSKIGNSLTTLLSTFICGRKISDTQTGLRGIGINFLPLILQLRATGYDYEMEMLLCAVENNISIVELPIETVYIDGNKSSHFNPVRDSLAIYFVLLRHVSNSITTAVIDYVAFAIIFSGTDSIPWSLLGGRITAGSFNFYIGKTFVFKSKGNFKLELIKYAVVVCSLMLFSYAGISFLTTHLPVSVYWAKVFVEFFVFNLAFIFQRLFVFNNSHTESLPTDWDSYYKKRSSKVHLPRKITEKLLLTEIKKNAIGKINTIIELGGGGSCFYKGIRAHFPSSHYKVIDKSCVGIDRFLKENKHPCLSAVCTDILAYEQTPEAELVFSVGLIEHFDRKLTARCIKAHFDCTKNGGLVIITYPTPTILYQFIRFIAERLHIWSFPDERPLKSSEVASEASKFGTLISRRLNWYIGLTQEIVVFKKGC